MTGAVRVGDRAGALVCTMLVADGGANVLRISRKNRSGPVKPRALRFNLPLRTRKPVAFELKVLQPVELVLCVVEAVVRGGLRTN